MYHVAALSGSLPARRHGLRILDVRTSLPNAGQHLEEAEILLLAVVFRFLERVLDAILEARGTRHAGMVFVHGIDRHAVEIQQDVAPFTRHQRLGGRHHAVELRVGVVDHDKVVEPVALLAVEVDLHLREVVDHLAGLEQVQAGSDGYLLGEMPPHLVPARNDFVVDEQSNARAEEREDHGPAHHRQEIDAAGAHGGDFAVGGQAREHEDRRDQEPQRNRPLHRLREGHEREASDESHGKALEDIADNLDHQPNRQHERQHEEREKERRQKRAEHIAFDGFHSAPPKAYWRPRDTPYSMPHGESQHTCARASRRRLSASVRW